MTQGQREIDRILEIMKETEEEKHKKDAAIKNLEKFVVLNIFKQLCFSAKVWSLYYAE